MQGIAVSISRYNDNMAAMNFICANTVQMYIITIHAY